MTSARLKWADYAAFTKFRLASLVLFSAILGYLIAAPEIKWMEVLFLSIGGFCITAASNGLNQIFERHLDRLMARTEARPLPQEKMSVTEAYIIVGVFILVGTVCLWYGTNMLTALLSLCSLVLYAFVYTPLKRKTSLAVFVGAFPGALPPLLGWTAATNEITYAALLIFSIQFMWQFPHFWAIAWRCDADYKKAGFNLLPFNSGHSRENAFQILLYNAFLIPVSILPTMFGYFNLTTGIILGVSSVLFMIPAIELFLTCSMKAATRLMFASFLYLPVVQIALWINL